MGACSCAVKSLPKENLPPISDVDSHTKTETKYALCDKTSIRKHQSLDATETYSQLMDMGFDELICFEAAHKYPVNINEAIQFVIQKQNDDKKQDEKRHNEIDTNYTHNTHIEQYFNCKSIETCLSLKRLINHLKFYKNYNDDNSMMDEHKLLQYINLNKSHLINDHHHILDHHLNEDNISTNKTYRAFELIYKQIMKNSLLCDVSKCNVYSRNNRERENQRIFLNKLIDKDLLVYIDILDSIHCYFIHSVDVGYRIINKLDVNNNNNDSNGICYDEQLFHLKSYLYFKRKHLEEIRGSNRLKNNKFMIQTNLSEKKVNELKDNEHDPGNEDVQTGVEDKQYSFGQRYNYWNKTDYDDYGSLIVTAKYDSLKTELISNKIYCVDIDGFNEAYNKANELINNCIKIKSIKANIYYDDNEQNEYKKYGIKDGVLLSISNLLSIIFYTDYDTLSYKFSTTFRRMSSDESDKDIVARNGEYFNWSKTLSETVNFFGTKMDESKFNVLYHGVSLIYFSSFISVFNSPTSTTTKLQIAAIFAKNSGIILELKKYDDVLLELGGYLRYFNCSFISCFGNEDERLFLQPPHWKFYPLTISSIHNVSTDEQYEDIIGAISKFEKIITSKPLKSKILSSYSSIINNLLSSNNINNLNYPIYIRKTLIKWINARREIMIYLPNLKEYGASICLLDQNVPNLLLFDKIINIFKQTEEIICVGTGNISESYLSSLLKMMDKINKLKYSALKQIKLSNVEAVELQSKYQDLFIKINWKIKKKLDQEPWGLIISRL